ncbi:SRPBCC family protein [Rhodococcoides yunnanense]|uniref:SRPBCC family protein n=1 Tax=Rhodococcoides yunnanense TaxID=278209 RepID=UPI000933A354|nr:SRPBCC family protein [Rhodococcus yunnanensis]
MISIDEEIFVPASPERVWAVISDPTEVVTCINGAELGEFHDDGSFDGTLVVKFSALRVRFGARMNLDLDEPEQQGRLSARGRDGQGATRFSAHAIFSIEKDEEMSGTRLRVSGEVDLAGKLAALIEAGAGVVVSRMMKDFSDELVRRCTATADTATDTADAHSALEAQRLSVPGGNTVVARTTVWQRVRAWWRETARRRQANRSGVK